MAMASLQKGDRDHLVEVVVVRHWDLQCHYFKRHSEVIFCVQDIMKMGS